MTEKFKSAWQRFAGLGAILFIAVSVFLAGMALMYWIGRNERMQLVDRIPQVRKNAEAAAAERYKSEIAGLKSENATLNKSMDLIAKSVGDTHDIAAYTLRFLGDRARLTDQRNAAMMKQTKVAADAAVDAKQTAEKVDQKVNVAVVKADEAASTAKAVDKKLETATNRTALVPPTPWAGNRR